MPLTVVSICSYLADRYPEGNPGRVMEACKFIKAIKGKKPVVGYAWIPVRGQQKKLEQPNRDRAIAWFGQMAADWLAANVTPPYSLVPVPNSSATTTRHRPRTALLAQAVSAATGQPALDVLRWHQDLGAASEHQGTRDPETIFGNIREIAPVPRGRVVLVDDVLTTGGHVRAVAAFLRQKGAVVRRAICAGRTVHDDDLPQDCFALSFDDYDDYEP